MQSSLHATFDSRDVGNNIQEIPIMKFTLLLLILFKSFITFGNEIEKLQTTEDVRKFISTISISRVNKFPHVSHHLLSTDSIANSVQCKTLFEQAGVLNWEKTDLNNDGETDLLFILSDRNRSYSYAVFYREENSYESKLLTHNECEFFKPIKLKGINYLKSYAIKDFPYNQSTTIDTLAFKYGGLVKKQDHISDYSIESISYSVSGSEVLPHYTIKINNENKVIYTQDYFSREKIQNTTIDPQKFLEFEDLLEYIRIKDQNEKFQAPLLDAAEIYLRIIFSDGSEKRIYDYGAVGSRELSFLYSKIEELKSEFD